MASKQLSPSYLDYIDSDAWRRRRALKLLLAGGLSGRVQCETCRGIFTVRRVDVHHETYERFGEERMSDLRVLCRDCHDLVKEIEAASDGSSMDRLSWQLLERLAAIDDRLSPKPVTVGPIIDSAVPRRECSLNELIAVISRKRIAFGIKTPTPDPDEF